jgi:HEAT repeat protein
MSQGITMHKIYIFAFEASLLLLAQQKPTTPALAPQPGMQSQTPSAKVKDAPQQPPTRKVPPTPKRQAWQMLTNAAVGSKTSERAIAIRVLGLMPNDAKALRLAEKALSDHHLEVRTAALGDMKVRSSIPKLREVLDDQEPSVALAAAHALTLMHDDDAYEVYYEVLNGQRKSGKGLIATQASILHDPKKMAELGFEEGIGFVPFAGMGWAAIKEIKKDDSSPVRAAAAKMLARDPDPATTIALTDAAGDKSWLVQAAALEALAIRGDPSVIDTVKSYMSDENATVKYTAAATFLRLTAIKDKNQTLRTLKN